MTVWIISYLRRSRDKNSFHNVHKFINQNLSDSMDHILSKTISGLSDFVKEIKPDLLIIHGDRVEALAGSAVGALNNILVAHIEGGEVSGTVDELIRHAVTKLSHVHLVANDKAKARLLQMGESEHSVYIIGSPDIDIMDSNELPNIEDVRSYYDFDFEKYGILIFHPVTTEPADIRRHIRIVKDQVINSGLNYIVIYPNNDHGTEMILEEYESLRNNEKIRLYPSMRFEYFLTAMKNAMFVIGNSSAGVREAPHYGVPAINIGSRQNGRANCENILDVDVDPGRIAQAISIACRMTCRKYQLFGTGNAAEKFYSILKKPSFFQSEVKKTFVDKV